MAALVAVALATAAGVCGDDDDDSASSSEPVSAASEPAATSAASETTETSAASDPADTSAPSDATAGTTAASGVDATDPAELLSVDIASHPPSFTSLPENVMEAMDLYEAHGIDPNVNTGAGSAALTAQAVIVGDADMAISGTGAVINAHSEGMTDLVILATMSSSVTFGIALTNEVLEAIAAQGVTPDSSAEERVQALAGLTIGAAPPGSTGDSYVRMLLTEYGLDPDTDITLQPSTDNQATVAAARSGRIDGYALSFPESLIPGVEGWGELWINFAEDLPSLVPLSAHTIYTTRQYLEENREICLGVVAALWDALDILQNRPDEAVELVKSERFPDLDQAIFDAGWEYALPTYAETTPITTEEMYQRSLDLVNTSRESPAVVEFGDVYDLTVPEEAQP